MTFNSEIYSYARDTRPIRRHIALDGSVIRIDRPSNASFYRHAGIQASEIMSAQAPTPPPTAQRFLDQLAKATRTAVRGSPAPLADVPAAASQNAPPQSMPPAAAEPARTYPLEDQKK